MSKKPKPTLTLASAASSDKKRIVIENALCFNLYTASRLMTQNYTDQLKPLGLTYLQFLVLNLLWAEEGQTTKQLGQRLYLDSGTLTPLLNKMIKMKLIKKMKSKTDKRESFIFLTEKGRELEIHLDTIAQNMFKKLQVSFDRFTNVRDGVKEILLNLNCQLNKE